MFESISRYSFIAHLLIFFTSSLYCKKNVYLESWLCSRLWTGGRLNFSRGRGWSWTCRWRWFFGRWWELRSCFPPLSSDPSGCLNLSFQHCACRYLQKWKNTNQFQNVLIGTYFGSKNCLVTIYKIRG